MIKSYADAARTFDAKSAKSRTYVEGVKAVRIAGNTTLRLVGADYVIRFHETDIVTYRPGLITIRSGGYSTMTTVQRIHEYTPLNIRANGKDVLSKRANADARIIVSVDNNEYGTLRSWMDIVSVRV